MAYESFWQAVAAYQRVSDTDYGLPRSVAATFIFQSLFEQYPTPEEDLLEDFIKSEEEAKWQMEKIGGLRIVVGSLSALPTNEMLDQLKKLEIPDTTYQPDADKSISWIDLQTAAYVQASILFTTWLLTGYGDDLRPAQSKLENLLARLKETLVLEEINNMVRSLSERIAAQFAYERGNYSAALERIVNSIEELRFFAHLNPEESILHSIGIALGPWLANGKSDAKTYLEMAKNNNANTDLLKIARACDRMGEYTLDYSVLIDITMLENRQRFSTSESDFWKTQRGWVEAQLTPDQLRSLYEGREDEAAANRLRIYFFPDGLWNHLSERSQQALVLADKQTVAGTAMSRRAGIFNELRIATEEVLHRHLWQPVSEWAKGQSTPPRGVAAVLAKPGEERRAPSISDLIQLLFTYGVRDYLRSIGVDDEGIRFLTKEKQAAGYLQRLRRERNRQEHEQGYASDPAVIRALYAEALGIGRKGVLPEMLRLLTRRREGRRPDVGGRSI